jgi:hypothetical protein
MQVFAPQTDTTRDSCQPSSAIAGQRRTPSSPKTTGSSIALASHYWTQKDASLQTAANHRQPLLDKGEHRQAQSATRSRIALRQPVLDSSRCRSPSPKFRRRQPQTVVGHCQTRACAGLQASETGKASRNILVSQCWTKVFAGFRASKPTSTSCHLSSAIAGLGCILDLRHGCQKNQTPIVVSQYWTRTSACKESLEVTGTVVSHCWTRVSEMTRCQTSQH